MGPRVEGLVQRADGTQLLIIDIDTWSSPVAKQYGIRSLPTLWLYEGTEKTSSDTRGVLRQLEE